MLDPGAALGLAVAMEQHADLVIRNARLIDGTGAPSRHGGVALRDGRIAAVGDVGGLPARHTLDAGGKALAPGFIDAHTHDDRALLSAPDMAMKVSQGVTTVICGNCGVSLAPLVRAAVPPPLDLIDDGGWYRFPTVAAFLAEVAANPPAVNAAFLVGHMTLRVGAMDRFDRAASPGEIAAMRARLEEGLAAGAIGFSTGLYYKPSNAAPTEEVIEVARPLKEAGGLYVTHMRDETEGVMDSLAETCRIGREVGVPVIVSHHKVVGVENFGRTRETLAYIDRMRALQEIGFDVYPYHASSTVLRMDTARRSRKVLVTWSRSHPEMAGRSLAEIAAGWGVDQDTAAERLQPAGAVYFSMDEEDVRRVLSHPVAMVGSDGLPHDAKPHPRLWGTFPRVLGHYSRELGLFALEEAVRRMTGLTAARFGLKDRGVLAPGAHADLVLFDPDTVIDRADFADSTRPADGILGVWVNGEPVWRDGAATGARPGRVLKRAA